MFAAAAAVSISILGWQISRNPAPKLYFQMAILIGKSRRRVNIIIWETSAGAAAHKTASAELKKHKGSREEMSPGLGGIRLVFLPGLDGTWEGATDERGEGEGSGGEGEH